MPKLTDKQRALVRQWQSKATGKCTLGGRDKPVAKVTKVKLKCLDDEQGQ